MFYLNKLMVNNFHMKMKFYSHMLHQFFVVFVLLADVRDYLVSMVQDYFENKNPLDNDFAIQSAEELPWPRKTKRERKEY